MDEAIAASRQSTLPAALAEPTVPVRRNWISLLFLANICNLVIAPQMVGFLSDWFAPHHIADAESLRLAMLCLVPTGFWAAWHYWLSARDVLADERLAAEAAAAAEANAQSASA